MSDKITTYQVTVNYKSGIQMRFNCVKFKVDTTPYGSKTYTWEASNVKGLRPLELQIDNVESVWYEEIN